MANYAEISNSILRKKGAVGEKRTKEDEFLSMVKGVEDIHEFDEFLLREAVRFNFFEAVKYLVEQGADIHINDDSPLQLAAVKGYLKIVKYLVEQGSDIHAENDATLKYAIGAEHTEVVDYLKEMAKREQK